MDVFTHVVSFQPFQPRFPWVEGGCVAADVADFRIEMNFDLRLSGFGFGCRHFRVDTDPFAIAGKRLKGDISRCCRENREVATHADILSWMEFGSALSNDDVSRNNVFTAKAFHTEAFAFAIATIAAGTATLLVRHR
jgi:hypothetical protein